MYKAVVSVHPNDDFSLAVVFEDGAEGVLDMTPYLDFGVFKKIKDFEQFKRVRIAEDPACSWPISGKETPWERAIVLLDRVGR